MNLLRILELSLPLTLFLLGAPGCAGDVVIDASTGGTGAGGAGAGATGTSTTATSTTSTATTATTTSGAGGATSGTTSTATSTATTISSTSTGGQTTPSGLETIALSTCGPLIYMAATTIGASQSFELLLDTGSTTLGVASSTCTGCGVSPEYTPGSTAVDENQNAESQYGTGSWTGEIYQDNVTLGTTTAPVRLVAIDKQRQFFEFPCGNVQGILGFGPTGAEVYGTQGTFDQIVATTQMPDVFSIELCDAAGTLWLGGYDAAVTTAAPQYVPLSSDMASQFYYSVVLTSVTVNGTTVPIATGQYPDSVVDTGTNGFVLGTTAYDALTAAIQSDAGFTTAFGTAFFGNGQGNPPCKAPQGALTKAELDASMPALTLNFGDVAIKVAATESYLFPDGSNNWCSSMAADPTLAQGAPLAAIFGSPMMRSNVVIFDRAGSRIGFAPHAACP